MNVLRTAFCLVLLCGIESVFSAGLQAQNSAAAALPDSPTPQLQAATPAPDDATDAAGNLADSPEGFSA